MKRVDLLIVDSTTRPGALGLRTKEGGLFGHLRDELKRAGFKAGDRVMIVPVPVEAPAPSKT